MKPFLEKVVEADDASWSMVRAHREPSIPFEWHHHPEFELTLTTNSRGHRFVGDHVGTYDDGDLVLIGPSLPHTWSSSSKINETLPHMVMVIWFRREWVHDLMALVTELRPIAALLDRSSQGLRFSSKIASRVRPAIEAIFDKSPAERLLDLISLLLTLAADEASVPLTAPTRSQAPTLDKSGSRIDRVLNYIHANYHHDIKVGQLASLAALSTSAFHRMFLRHTRLTLSNYVTRLRIGEACARLIADSSPVAVIAERVGYRSLANFGRQFKALKGQTPREYRKHFTPGAVARSPTLALGKGKLVIDLQGPDP